MENIEDELTAMGDSTSLDDLDGMDGMDDLFVDEDGQLQDVSTQPQGMLPRLYELQDSSCCQKVAWSKSGCVANITSQGHSVTLQVCVRDAPHRAPTLSQPVSLDVGSHFEDDVIVHLCWSSSGTELAIVGASGRVAAYKTGSTVDQMELIATYVHAAQEEQNAVVAIEWYSNASAAREPQKVNALD